jgi:MFS family permease
MWLAFFLTFSSVQIITGFSSGSAQHLRACRVVRTAGLCLMTRSGDHRGAGPCSGISHRAWRAATAVRPGSVAALLVMAFRPRPPVMVGFAVLGISFACATPGINGSASLSIEPHQQGAASGYLAASNTVGAILGPLVGTSIYKIAPNATMLAGAGLFTLLSIYAFTIRVPQTK